MSMVPTDVKTGKFSQNFRFLNFQWTPEQRNFQNLIQKSIAIKSSQPVDMSRYQVFHPTPPELGDP